MKQRDVIMVIDTETCTLEGPVYDLGYTIATRRGQILAERNWLVSEIFQDGSRMMGAFYARKFFEVYARLLQSGGIRLTQWADIARCITSDAQDYAVTTVAAYNFRFDRKVIRNTSRTLGYPYAILPPMRQLCLWQFVRKTKLGTKSFRKFARENGYVTQAGTPRTTAEIAYRYIVGEWDFIEAHTALDDCRIETEIMARCFAAKKKVPYL